MEREKGDEKREGFFSLQLLGYCFARKTEENFVSLTLFAEGRHASRGASCTYCSTLLHLSKGRFELVNGEGSKRENERN